LAVELPSVVGLSVNEVACRLGYSDTTAFSHAFRRWTGETGQRFLVQSSVPQRIGDHPDPSVRVSGRMQGVQQQRVAAMRA
jgi:AraC-like DNA-binding protein